MLPRTKSLPHVTQLQQGILKGERAALAMAITLSESTLFQDRKKVERLLKKLLPFTGQSLRIGITGVPGAGKSTFIEVLGECLTKENKKVAVLAIDPTSQLTKGSILGDKTRMEKLSRHPDVFIRPTPSSLALGGVSYHTRECILLCEAAGFDIILIETVGVGQSETYVRHMVDFFLLLMLGGAGDELQGIKKGIMEMADAVIINKADGENMKASLQAKADAQQALHLHTTPSSGWTPKVMTVSSKERKGIAEIWTMIKDYQQQTSASGYFLHQRELQKKQWLDESIEGFFLKFMQGRKNVSRKTVLLKDVMKGKMLPGEAARKFWDEMIKGRPRKE